MQSIMPPTLDTIIAMAADFSDDVYQLLEGLVKKPNSIDPSDADITAVSRDANIPEDDLRYFLSFLSFLYVQTSDTAEDELETTLAEFLTEHGENVSVDRVAKKLVALLSYRDIQTNAAKRARLVEGFLPNLLEISSFVDVRKDFERDDEGNLSGKLGFSIPVIQLRLRTNSSRQDEREFVLQLDEKAIKRFEEAFVEIRTKIRILES